MQLFLDTADIEEIREAAEWGVISGVTTNPSLIAKEGRDFFTVVKEIAGLVDGPISAEVISENKEGMLAEADKLAKLHKNIIIKVPMTIEGLKAIKILNSKDIKTNATLIFTPNQALLAARAGATYLSPFVGRLDDIGEEGMEMVRVLMGIIRQYGLKSKVIAASIRHPQHILEAMKAGADIATLPFGVLKQLVSHPLTTAGIQRFLEDWKNLEA